jgi:hypothetical protein
MESGVAGMTAGPPEVTSPPPPPASPSADASYAQSRPDATAPEVPVTATDAAAEVAPGEVAALISCDELAAGGMPDRLSDFQWMIQTSFNQAFYDTVTFDSTCKLSYQAFTMGPPNMPPGSTTRGAMMLSGDCAAARSWATNERFLQVLRTGDNCPYGPGNPGDLFDLTLTGEGRVARKTYLCSEPTVEAVRVCLRALVARYFP